MYPYVKYINIAGIWPILYETCREIHAMVVVEAAPYMYAYVCMCVSNQSLVCVLLFWNFKAHKRQPACSQSFDCTKCGLYRSVRVGVRQCLCSCRQCAILLSSCQTKMTVPFHVSTHKLYSCMHNTLIHTEKKSVRRKQCGRHTLRMLRSVGTITVFVHFVRFSHRYFSYCMLAYRVLNERTSICFADLELHNQRNRRHGLDMRQFWIGAVKMLQQFSEFSRDTPKWQIFIEKLVWKQTKEQSVSNGDEMTIRRPQDRTSRREWISFVSIPQSKEKWLELLFFYDKLTPIRSIASCQDQYFFIKGRWKFGQYQRKKSRNLKENSGVWVGKSGFICAIWHA